MAGPQVVIEMSGKEARLWRAQQRIIQQQVQVETGYRRVGQSARESGREAAAGAQQSSQGAERVAGAIMSIGAGLVGGAGVLGAVNRVNQAYEVWRANMAEIATEARKAGDEILAFSALQEGGTRAKQVQDFSNLATAYGIPDRGAAFNVGQSLQSMYGSLEAAMPAIETVFMAKHVGMPVELGREAEVQGKAQGMLPGEMTRMLFVGGQASGRDPELLAPGAVGLKYFDNKAFGTALAGQLTASIKPRQLATYLKSAGQALSDTSPLMPWFEEHSVGAGASQQTRFRALADAGIDTDVKFEQIGLTTKEEREGVFSVIRHAGKIDELTEEIKRKVADEDILVKLRAEMEIEQPSLRTIRETMVVESRQSDELAFGPRAQGALEYDLAQKKTGTVFTEMGMRQALWADLQDEDGKTSDKGWWAAFADRLVRGKGDIGKRDVYRFREGEATEIGEPDWGRQVLESSVGLPIPGLNFQMFRRSHQFLAEYNEKMAEIDQDVAKTDPALKLTPEVRQARRQAEYKETDDAIAEAPEVAGMPAATPPMRRGPSSMRMNPNQARFYEELNQQMRAADPGAYGYVPNQPPTTKAPGVPTADDALAQLNENYAAAERAGPTDTGGGADLADTLLQLRRQQNAVPSAAPAAVPTADDAVAQLNRNYAAAEQAPPATGPAPTWPTPAVEQVASGMLGPDDIREFGVSTQDLKEAAGALRGLRDQATMGRVGLGSPDRDQ